MSTLEVGNDGPLLKDLSSVKALMVINNAISVRLASELLRKDGIALNQVALILLREVRVPWASECAVCLRYGAKPEHGLLGQRRFAGFYLHGAKLLRRLLKLGRLQRVYAVNNDNLLTSALFLWAERKRLPPVTVIAEGIMNYQEIDLRDRANWRWKLKPLLATVLGLPYRIPQGHLSGAFEPAVDRVVSFTDGGLKAPPSRITLLPFPKPQITVVPEPNTCLIVHTGLWQWMTEDAYQPFAEAFVHWLRAQGFARILAKPHPHIATGLLNSLLPPHELLKDPRSIEDMAGEIPAATIVGTCCTGLATLKLMRPDLRCIDFGADYYCEKAYHGDVGVRLFLEHSHVELVDAR